jgi:hypothetical protein
MPEPSLRRVQQWMQSRIRPGAGARAPGPGPLNPQRGTPGDERLAVYAGGYVARIHQALAEVYAAVTHVLGERAFHELAEAYAARHPSRETNLTFAGRHLPEFLAGWPKTAELPFLPDLARLEWQLSQAFHAFDEPPLELSALAGLSPQDWERATLVFQPSVSTLDSAWPVLDIWAARATPREQIHLEVADRPQRAAVFRRGLEARCAPLEPAQQRLLQDLLDGMTLGQACGRALERRDDPPSLDPARDGAPSEVEGPPLAAWFAEWAAAGWIVRCELAA